MIEEPAEEAAPSVADRTPLDWLEVGLAEFAKAIRLATISAGAFDATPRIWRHIVGEANAHDENARNALNKVREALGGEPLPDPSEPPPVRPDD